MKSSLKKSLSLIFFAIGVALLFGLISSVGWQNVLKTFHELHYQIVYVLIFPITWYALQSFAWWRVITDDGHRVSYRHVLMAKLTGEAVNTVTPVSFIGGDPFRIYLLQKILPATDSLSSVVIDRTMNMLAIFLFLTTAMIVGWFALPLPEGWQSVFLLVVIGFFIGFLFLVAYQKKGMFTSITNLVKKLGFQKERIERLAEKIEQIDEQVGGFYRKHKFHFFEIVFLHYIGRFLGVVELYLIVNLLNLPVTFVHCLFLSTLTVFINIAFVFIPGSMGVMESGYGALFYLLKLNPAYGVGIQLVRRVRTFFWIIVGLVILLIFKPKLPRKN